MGANRKWINPPFGNIPTQPRRPKMRLTGWHDLVMSQEQFAELMAVVGLANETNRLANGYDVPVDGRFLQI